MRRHVGNKSAGPVGAASVCARNEVSPPPSTDRSAFLSTSSYPAANWDPSGPSQTPPCANYPIQLAVQHPWRAQRQASKGLPHLLRQCLLFLPDSRTLASRPFSSHAPRSKRTRRSPVQTCRPDIVAVLISRGLLKTSSNRCIIAVPHLRWSQGAYLRRGHLLRVRALQSPS
ncbi:hypothetical protein BD311DRAFT_59196 [Dichomitus squalens]|uniref:Uncharacterized protein n=1 Tax=Dichomitus squalens TaxID=114155 RepID=A0A4Q9MW03_9APHY|nr:hypothetical protein BD311DRAFT_59196 [Dichomitus squalens]